MIMLTMFYYGAIITLILIESGFVTLSRHYPCKNIDSKEACFCMGIFYYLGGERMKFLKAFNNNVALVTDSAGIEWIVIGNGIGFQMKYGNTIDNSKIRKKFISDNIDNKLSVSDVLEGISMEEHQITMDIIQLAEEELSINFSSSNYLTLADHVHHAILRSENLSDESVDGNWEIKQLYQKEYQLSEKILEFLDSNYDIELPNSEIVYLTFHFVTAQNNWVFVSETIEMTKMIRRILDIIKNQFQTTIDTESSDYGRFVTHLRYFFLRYHSDEKKEYHLNNDIIQLVIEKYPKSFNICKKIAQYLYEELGWELTNDELVYLTFHVIRLMNRED